MATISLRVNDADYNIIQEYVSVNNMSLSSFVREAVLDRIEQDFKLDEARIASARERAHAEAVYSHEDVWKELGV